MDSNEEERQLFGGRGQVLVASRPLPHDVFLEMSLLATYFVPRRGIGFLCGLSGIIGPRTG